MKRRACSRTIAVLFLLALAAPLDLLAAPPLCEYSCKPTTRCCALCSDWNLVTTCGQYTGGLCVPCLVQQGSEESAASNLEDVLAPTGAADPVCNATAATRP